jgi:histidinol dehydrogenase
MTALFRFEGPVTLAALADRRVAEASVAADTASIIAQVRDGGDEALRALACAFDGVTLDALEVARGEWQLALAALAQDTRHAMQRAIRNIRTAHAAFAPVGGEVETEPGVIVGRRPDPLDRVGIYAPGGRATYPSSLLMGAIPARVAGVREVIVCSPRPSAALLAAAELAGVDRVFAVGGAGAIAAMAFGTETIPRVDKIVGPGNAYVAEAKLQLAGVVASEAPAGPSELLIIADDSADPTIVAREALAQAEHDPRAAVIIITLGSPQPIRGAICARLGAEPRRAIIAEALSTRGGLLVATSIDSAVSFANAWAPEHLLLAIAAPHAVLHAIRNAGTVFLGQSSSVAFGDYITGANHVLPTGGLARSYSGLSTQDFVRWTTYQRVDASAASRLARDTAVFAEAEQLDAHARAARAWEVL